MDVTDPNSIESAFDQGEAAFGTITVVANNAGVADMRSALKIDESSWDRMMDTNPKGSDCGSAGGKTHDCSRRRRRYCQYGINTGFKSRLWSV